MNGTLDYASEGLGRPPWRLTPRGRKILLALIFGAVVASTLILVYRHRVRAASVVSRGGGGDWYPDGRDVQFVILGNANHKTTAVLIFHYSTIDPTRRVIKPGKTWVSPQVGEGVISNAIVKVAYPPDPDASGVWIDGQRRPLSDKMLVVYLSDKLPATDIALTEAEQVSFLIDARNLDSLVFIEKWITPRLPAH